MRMKTDPAAVWAEYEEGRRYNEAIDLYKNVESYEAFYTGDQWRGLNAPDLMKVQLNFLGRVVSACIAKVVSDDFTAAFTPFEHTSWTDTASAVLTREVERAAELINLRHLHKENVRDAAVDGDACNYFWFDPEAPYGGRIRAESVENTAVLFGNPYEKDVQLQPYLILALRRRVEDVKEEAASFGADDETLARIAADRNADRPEKDGEDRLCTVLVKFFKQDGEVRCLKTTEHALVRPAFHTGLTLYPVAWMNWEKVRGSFHGRSAIAGMLPNQIALNKAYSGIIRQVMTSGFPTLFYNRQFVEKWDGRPGRAVAVQGSFDPSKAASYLTGPGVDPSITNVMDNLVTMTKEFMGTSDVTLGTAKAQNASAIIALQNADTAPMELHRQEFYAFIEQEMRILADLIRACWGVRGIDLGNGPVLIDFAQIPHEMQLRVDVGAASYWSESLQAETLNTLFTSGVVRDAGLLGLYLDVMPRKYLPGLEKLRAYQKKLEGETHGRNEGNETGTGAAAV